jgi:hypothetical protein
MNRTPWWIKYVWSTRNDIDGSKYSVRTRFLNRSFSEPALSLLSVVLRAEHRAESL